MTLDLADYEAKTRLAVKSFWGNREAAAERQRLKGISDAGTRGAVTAGKNLDAFVGLFTELVHANGLRDASVHISKGVVTLPGYFRPTKQWDILVMHRGRLIAALELKSMVGSFGNNFNNRIEEALGSALDLWTAFREGAFGEQPRPFVGWMLLLEDAPGSRDPKVRESANHFKVFPEFRGASYADRFNIFCQKLMAERLYSAASLIVSPASAFSSGEYDELSDVTGMRNLVASFAGHIATEAARS